MKMRSVLPMKIAKYGYIVISIVFCIAGILMILMPAPSAAFIGNLFGAAMLVFGILKIIGYFSKDLFRLAFQYDLQFGILLFLLGIITLIKTDNAMNFICISLGVCIILDSLFKINTALEAKCFGIRTWWLTLALSVITAAAGLLLVFRPSETLHGLIVLLGISILTEGILSLSVAVSLVKIINNQMPDIIETDYRDIS